MATVGDPSPRVRSWVLVDGGLVDPGDPLVAANDRGLLSGDGVYTTMGVFGGVPFAISRHRRRLRESLAHLGLDAAEVPWDRLAGLPREFGVADGRLRITVTAGPGAPADPVTRPTVFATLAEVDRSTPTPAMAVVTGGHPRDPGRFDAGHKTIAGAGNTRAVLAWARRRGATEYLYPTPDGGLSEGTTTNLVVVTNGEVATPDLRTGCLPGITRRLLLEAGLVVETDHLDPDHACEADEVILTSSVRGVIPVASVDGRPMPGRDGPVWRRLHAFLADLQATNPDP